MAKKVILGLSGGVDSAVEAYVLKQQGYDVECCFMRNWDSAANNDYLGNPNNDLDQCPQEKDYYDACAVADALGLKMHRVDFVNEYWDNVFQTFIDEYKKGRTPNPDILCNKYIKFDYFLKHALMLGADYVATGHYARVVHNEDGSSVMLRGIDSNKDQTYFLCQLNQYQLSKTLFPIGDIEKPEVRKIANELELLIANKKDSTGICFIGERNFREFLKNYIPMKEGDIVEYETKRVLGRHQGVMYYTIGQRKGLGIGGPGGPWFVIGKDVETNVLYVASGSEDKWLMTNSCLVSDVNYIGEKFEGTLKCTAKFRYRQKDHGVSLKWLNESQILVTYDYDIPSVTPGQACVFYLGDVCLGGGTIDEVYKDGEKLPYLK